MEKKEIWSKVLQVIITVLTAIATTLLIYYNTYTPYMLMTEKQKL